MEINIFGIGLHPYGLMIGLGILVGWQAAAWLGKDRKIPVDYAERLFWWTVIFGVVGARLYHVVDKWETIYRFQLLLIFEVWKGGLGIWGAVIGGIIGLITGKKILKVDIGLTDLLDMATFGLPLGQAIGRWGNFFNGEIVGRNGEPLFLYESLLNLVLFGILLAICRRVRPGVLTGVYLVGYGLIRLGLEPLRPDEIVWHIGGVPVAMIFSAVAILIGTLMILVKAQFGRSSQ